MVTLWRQLSFDLVKVCQRMRMLRRKTVCSISRGISLRCTSLVAAVGRVDVGGTLGGASSESQRCWRTILSVRCVGMRIIASQ